MLFPFVPHIASTPSSFSISFLSKNDFLFIIITTGGTGYTSRQEQSKISLIMEGGEEESCTIVSENCILHASGVVLHSSGIPDNVG